MRWILACGLAISWYGARRKTQTPELSSTTMVFLRIAFIASLLVFASSSVFADTLRVGPSRVHATIQDAVDHALPGDAILIDPGLYAETVLVDQPNLKIGPAKKGKSGSVTIDGGSASVPLTLGLGSDGSTVKNLTITNPGAVAGILIGLTVDVKVVGCKVKGGAAQAGIRTFGAINCTISKCTVKDASAWGFYLYAAPGTSVRKCKVVDSAGDGFVIASDNVSITDNKIIRPGGDGIVMGDLVSAISCVGSLVSRNVVDSAINGIVLTSESSQCVVEKNLIRSSGDDGLVAALTAEHLLTKNRTIDSGGDGVEVDGSSVLMLHRNVSRDNTDDNFDLFSNSSYVNLVKNKSRRSGDDGIEIDGNNHTVIRNNSRKSGNLDPTGLDFETATSADCFFLDNKYQTGDF